jgi:hypothetical protein
LVTSDLTPSHPSVPVLADVLPRVHDGRLLVSGFAHRSRARALFARFAAGLAEITWRPP